MLQHAIDAVNGSRAMHKILVLGAHAPLILPAIEPGDIHTVINTDWLEGMASSIRYGLQQLLHIRPNLDTVIFLTCDQPFTSSELLDEMIEQHELSGKAIVACSYAQTNGIPVLFEKHFFGLLLQLKGDTGAKRILKDNQDSVFNIHFPEGSIDIDTAEAYSLLLKENSAE
jgi:molybdenum cofactor cytidylyltransferase